MSFNPTMNPDDELAVGDYLTPERAVLWEPAAKNDLLIRLAGLLSTAPEVSSPEELQSGILRREALLSTGIGLGIGVPHVRLPSVSRPVMAAALVPGGVTDYAGFDGAPVRLVLMIAAGSEQHHLYLMLLSKLSTRLKDDAFRERLFQSRSDRELFLHLTSRNE